MLTHKAGIKRLGLPFVLILAFALFLFVRERKARIQKHFNEEIAAIDREMAAQNFTRAINPLQAALKSGEFASIPDSASQLHHRLGSCMASVGQSGRALEEWAQVDPKSPLYARSLANSASLFINSGRYRAAEEALTEAFGQSRSAEDAAQSLKTLSRLLRFEGRTEELKRAARASFDFRPDRVELLKEIWLTDYSPVPIESWKRALDSANPEDDRVLLGQAAVAAATGQNTQAREFLARIAAANPQTQPADGNAVTRLKLSLAMAEADIPLFWQAAERLSAAFLDRSEPLSIQAWLAAQSGDLAREKTALLELLKLDPARGDALQRLAELALKAGDPAQARHFNDAKATLDKAKDRVRKLLLSGEDLTKPAPSGELSALMRQLGRSFDEQAWASLSRPLVSDPPQIAEHLAQLKTADTPRLAELLKSAGFVPPTERPDAKSSEKLATGSSATKPLAWPQFEENAAKIGLNFTYQNGQTPEMQLPETMSGGVAVLDFDCDGWLDIYLPQGGSIGKDGEKRPCEDRLFRNLRDGTFKDVTEQAGLNRFAGDYAMGVAVGDYDNDGFPDLFVSRLRSYALYRNKGDGTFEDATAMSGLAGKRDNPTSAAFADLDNDGDLDLYVCHYMIWNASDPRLCRNDKGGYFYCDPSKVDPAPDHLFRNDGGKFVDVTAEAGIVDVDGRGLGVVASDLDADGKLDLYVANDGTANFFFRNSGGLKFEEQALAAGLAGSEEGGFQASMGVACGDYDGDGRPDLVVTNFYGECSTIYQNLGQGLFRARTTTSGLGQATRFLLGFGTSFGDLNNDGTLDLATINGHVNDNRPYYPYAMPAQLLLGTPNAKFVEAPANDTDPWRVPRVGRGLAVADLNNDGQLDAILLAQNDPAACLTQLKPKEAAHWLTFGFESGKSNRDGVGVKLFVKAGGKTQLMERFGGGSYQSAGDPRLHVGLGMNQIADEVEAHWPSGKVVKYNQVSADKAYLLREDSPELKSLPGFARP